MSIDGLDPDGQGHNLWDKLPFVNDSQQLRRAGGDAYLLRVWPVRTGGRGINIIARVTVSLSA